MRKTIITLIWSLAIVQAMAQQAPPDDATTHSFSLQDCINYAYEHQDSVKNATLDVKSADYKVKETIGQGLPQVNGSISFQDYTRAPATVGPDFSSFTSGKPVDPKAPLVVYPFGAVQYNNTYTAQASQLLFSGTFLVGLKAVKTFKELSQRSLTRSKIDANIAVTKAYYQVLVGNEQIRLLDANINQLKQQVNETTQSNKQGFVEKIDVDRITVQYNNLVTTRENTVRGLTLYNAMLKFQMGMPIGDELILTDKLADLNLGDAGLADKSQDSSAYHNRIEYDLLQTNKHLNELDVLAKKAEFLPTVTANGAIATVFQENQTRLLYKHNYPYSYIGLSVNIPIFSGGQRINQLRQKQIEVQKADNALESARNAFMLQATSARVSFVNSLQSLSNQKRNQALANDVLRVSKIKYQQGVGSSIEVTQAQTELENSDNQYIQALYDALINKVNLDQAYGRIK